MLIKGILSPEDAELCIQHGADGIIVSNHGGRSMDYGPSTLEVLPDIVAVVGRRVPVMGLHVMANALGRDFDVGPAVAGLVDKEILVIDERDMWSFKSDLIREVAYNTITKYDRAKRHALASDHLPATSSSR